MARDGWVGHNTHSLILLFVLLFLPYVVHLLLCFLFIFHVLLCSSSWSILGSHYYCRQNVRWQAIYNRPQLCQLVMETGNITTNTTFYSRYEKYQLHVFCSDDFLHLSLHLIILLHQPSVDIFISVGISILYHAEVQRTPVERNCFLHCLICIK